MRICSVEVKAHTHREGGRRGMEMEEDRETNVDRGQQREQQGKRMRD